MRRKFHAQRNTDPHLVNYRNPRVPGNLRDPVLDIQSNHRSNIQSMKYKYNITNRQYMVDQIEEELGMTIDSWEWSDREIQDMYDTLIGSMYNGIYWNR